MIRSSDYPSNDDISDVVIRRSLAEEESLIGALLDPPDLSLFDQEVLAWR